MLFLMLAIAAVSSSCRPMHARRTVPRATVLCCLLRILQTSLKRSSARSCDVVALIVLELASAMVEVRPATPTALAPAAAYHRVHLRLGPPPHAAEDACGTLDLQAHRHPHPRARIHLQPAAEAAARVAAANRRREATSERAPSAS